MLALVIVKSLAIRATSPFRLRVVGSLWGSLPCWLTSFKSVVGRISETGDRREETGGYEELRVQDEDGDEFAIYNFQSTIYNLQSAIERRVL
jgi:hypothetical protein